MENKKIFYESINLISNTNNINLKEFKKEKPISYAFYCLEVYLNNSGMSLNFINQDNNRVYFKVYNQINKYTSYIMDLSYNELLRMDIYTADGIKQEVWNRGV
jgi:hypothetical protein